MCHLAEGASANWHRRITARTQSAPVAETDFPSSILRIWDIERRGTNRTTGSFSRLTARYCSTLLEGSDRALGVGVGQPFGDPGRSLADGRERRKAGYLHQPKRGSGNRRVG